MKFDKFTLTYFIIRFVRRPQVERTNSHLMKLHFDSKQEFQLEDVKAITNIVEGQTLMI